MSCPRPVVPWLRSVIRLVNQVRVSASSESSSSSESVGTVVCPTGIVPFWGMIPASGVPGSTSISMSFSGVLGNSTADALRYSLCGAGSWEGFSSMWMIAWPSDSDVPVISPTLTPATLTGSPSPGTTPAAVWKRPLTFRSSRTGSGSAG